MALWRWWRGTPGMVSTAGMGGAVMRSGQPGCLPDAGGINDQCAWLMDAFAILTVEFERKDDDDS